MPPETWPDAGCADTHSRLDRPERHGVAGSRAAVAADCSTPDALIHVLVDAPRMNAFLRLEALSESTSLNPDTIVGSVKDVGVFLVEEALCRLKECAASFCRDRTPVELFPIAQGLEPLAGEDGKIEWALKYFEKKPTDDDARIDFHEKAPIRNVLQGEKILTIIPPERGLTGLDVFGRKVPARPGKPVVVLCGSHVRKDAGGVAYYAEVNGRVSLDRNTLRVDPVYEVIGDVDFSVGNIDFSGVVHISGGVQDGFAVKAARGITIGETVGAASLESDGDITIGGGMAGRGKGRIRCRGSLAAKYLNQVAVEVGGDLSVSTEIRNCAVNCRGNVRVAQGSIVSGATTAFGSIFAPTIGSPMGVKTLVAAGVDFSVAGRRRELCAAIAASAILVRRISERVGPLHRNRAMLAMLPLEKLEIIRDLLLHLQNEQQALAALRAQKLEIAAAGTPRARAAIEVSRRLYCGVEATLTEYHMTNVDDLDGPIKLVVSESEGKVKVRALDR
ncbi:MAG: FapA family protein [Planctomycetota bacterium]|nr:FapA family protein [Planctomycetota bacterium]